MNIGDIENVDFDAMYVEVEKRIRAADSSKDWLQWRDTWMFLEGVSLLMQYDSPEQKENFEELCKTAKRRTEEATKEYFNL